MMQDNDIVNPACIDVCRILMTHADMTSDLKKMCFFETMRHTLIHSLKPNKAVIAVKRMRNELDWIKFARALDKYQVQFRQFLPTPEELKQAMPKPPKSYEDIGALHHFETTIRPEL